jgi:hypothetical protein
MTFNVFFQIFQNEDKNNLMTSKLNIELLISASTNKNEIPINKNQQTCWCLSNTFQSNFEFIENQTLHFINLVCFYFSLEIKSILNFFI